MSIPSPYNFVPLADKVFFPDWARLASMDVPFSDGISGTLAIEVTAKTPIFIRGKEGDSEFFKLPDGRYAIPGTSFKGMIRNVIEIISFGKMSPSRFDDRRYGYRDLNNKEYTDRITDRVWEKGRLCFIPKVHAGWLTEDSNGEWKVVPCEFARVDLNVLEGYREEHRDIKKYQFEKELHKRQTSMKKYNTWKKDFKSKDEPFKVFFSKPVPVTDHMVDEGYLRYNIIRALSPSEEDDYTMDGELVFTGQPQEYDGAKGKKHMEFVFYTAPDSSPGDPLRLSPKVRDDFEFVHSDLAKYCGGVKDHPNDTWRYWRDKLRNRGRVPVFFLKEGEEIASLGLAMMYRLPYTYSIKDLVENYCPAHVDESRLDLAETMFGWVADKMGRGEQQPALRGRIQVGALPAEKGATELEVIETTLNEPRPTFYPNYIEQRERGGKLTSREFRTYDHKNARIRGWKRYPVRAEIYDDIPPSPGPKMTVAFKPLKEGVVFRGKINLHNVKPVELGALLWALTWGGDEQLRHNLGMAKPFGFGSVKVGLKLEESDLFQVDSRERWILSREEAQEWRGLFQKAMDSFLGEKGTWLASEQMRELLAMADQRRQWPEDMLEYPDAPKRFAGFKLHQPGEGNPGRVLIRYSGVEKKLVGARNKRSPKAVGSASANKNPEGVSTWELYLRVKKKKAGNKG